MKIQDWWSSLSIKYQNIKQSRRFQTIRQDLENALTRSHDAIPCIIVSYNNGIYVSNTVNQLSRYGLTPIVIDNHSSDSTTLAALDTLQRNERALVVRSDHNFGHLVGFLPQLYPLLPEVFAYTDPDLAFNADLPSDFLSVLADLATRYSVFKAGFALSVPDDKQVIDAQIRITREKPFIFHRSYSVREWESQFWAKPLQHEFLDIFAADVDTTFAVYQKKNYRGNFFDAIRVGGHFSAIHLPWFPSLDLFDQGARQRYLQHNRSTTWVRAD